MTTDLDNVIARLHACTQAAAATVADEPPPWRPRGRLTTRPAPPARRPARWRWAAVATATVAVGLVGLALHGRAPTQSLNAKLIAATRQTIAAHTARIRVTGTPIGGQTSTAAGVVDFDTGACDFSYPSGFRVIDTGSTTYTTIWPIRGAITWMRQPDTTPAGDAPAALARALRPNTTASTLLAALRARTTTITAAGTERIDAVTARHYHAAVDTTWSADVWVSRRNLVRIAVHSPAGAATIDYYDYGVAAAIQPPPPAQVLASS